MLKKNPSYPANVAIVTTPPQKNVNENKAIQDTTWKFP